jgi:hypothetical protein
MPTSVAQVATSQYDNSRTGATLTEKILTPPKVNATRFGKLGGFKTDGVVYAQPLFIPSVEIPNKARMMSCLSPASTTACMPWTLIGRAIPRWCAMGISIPLSQKTAAKHALIGICALESQRELAALTEIAARVPFARAAI